MKALVTGAAGFIGRHLVSALRSRSAEVTIFDNLHRGQPVAGDGAALKIADIRDRVALATAMKGVDVVYHLAAQSNVLGATSDPDYSFSTNVVGTYNVLRSAQEQGVRRECSLPRVRFTETRKACPWAKVWPFIRRTCTARGKRPVNSTAASLLPKVWKSWSFGSRMCMDREIATGLYR
jgi:NAD(P)-dependent dehydrogenase (short-subunit alcohol dehydrogenase family)